MTADTIKSAATSFAALSIGVTQIPARRDAVAYLLPIGTRYFVIASESRRAR